MEGRGCSDDVMLATPRALVVGGYAKINSSAFISLPSLHAQVRFTWRTCSRTSEIESGVVLQTRTEARLVGQPQGDGGSSRTAATGNEAQDELCIPFLGAALSPGGVSVSAEMSSGCLSPNHKQVLKSEIQPNTYLPAEK